jgi:hypothetical protein
VTWGRGGPRRIGYEAVGDYGKESSRDQDRCGESKHSKAIHGHFLGWIIAEAARNLLTAR